MEINYPIKYALLPIESTKNGETFVNKHIVSKCFVIEETTKYGASDVKKDYVVVFPYYYCSRNGMWLINRSLTELLSGASLELNDIASVNTSAVFDTYEEAEEYLKNNANSYQLFDEYINISKETIDYVDEVYKLLEAFIDENISYIIEDKSFDRAFSINELVNNNKGLKLTPKVTE